MRSNKIYTRKGDKGQTATLRGPISKTDDLAEALGSIDELNSFIGFCQEKITIQDELKRIQGNLMTINAILAGANKIFKSNETKHLEKLIDNLQEELPPLTNFIYPVGELQYARTLARKGERRVVVLNNQITNHNFPKNYKLEIQNFKNILKYLNRLSDGLFVMGRWVNKQEGRNEEVWKG